MFKIGIGPSSSHTVGPMVAARRFLTEAKVIGVFGEIAQVEVDLYGSLALTGLASVLGGSNEQIWSEPVLAIRIHEPFMLVANSRNLMNIG